MNKKILHISHHIGCFKDQNYVLKQLGYDVVNFKFYDKVFQITKNIADNFWNEKKDYLNSFDYILTSDTAPLSRIFLENQHEFKSKLIIWICNRFDYRMETEKKFYELFSEAEKNPNIKIIPYTHFEKIWCEYKGIKINQDTITPIGKTLPEDEKNIPNIKYYCDEYGGKDELPEADVIVPIYYNDNIFFKMSEYLKNKNILVYNGGYNSPNQLKKYKAFITMPDAFSKFLAFEMIHSKIPVILPSKKCLFKLSKQEPYFFNIWGSGGANFLQEEWIDWCEWYDPNLINCRLYYDSIEEIPEIIKNIDKNQMDEHFNNGSKYLENRSLNKWKNFYNNF